MPTRPALLLLVFCVALAPFAHADVGPPAHLQITEIDEGVFRVQWRVPDTLPPRAIPTPMLPESCGSMSEPVVSRYSAAWLFEAEWSCREGLAQQSVGLHYPFREFALTTVIRVELLSGDRFAHLLGPGETSWRLPEGTAAPDRLRQLQLVVLAGVTHVATSPLHYLFLLVVLAMGASRDLLRRITVFSLGQVLGAWMAPQLVSVNPALFEVGFAAGVAVLAGQALVGESERRRVTLFCALLGVLHGMGIPSLLGSAENATLSRPIGVLLLVLGMDAAHLAAGFVISYLGSSLRRVAQVQVQVQDQTRTQDQSQSPTQSRRFQHLALRGVGVLAVAFALIMSWQSGADTTASDASDIMPSFSSSDGASAAPGSRRLAPTAASAMLQSYFVVEPFELRHEVMVRVVGMVAELGITSRDTLTIQEQPAILDAIGAWVSSHSRVEVDGVELDGLLRRSDFMSVDASGALPRPNPVDEDLFEASVGVVVSYPVGDMPQRAVLSWNQFPERAPMVPCTVIDPENVLDLQLSTASPSAEWENRLLEDPLPQVSAVRVEPLRVPIPWLSLPLLLGAGILLVVYLRTKRNSVIQAAAPRILLAAAVLAGPIVQSTVAVAGAGARVPSERQARRILGGLLPNVYRAIEFRDEATIYDRLAITVTDEYLTEIYLQQRHALELEERGGAQARVESVEILEATELSRLDDGFSVLCTWRVGGMVTHFGHRHLRQNRYHARIDLVADGQSWKIRHLEVLEQDRLK